MRMISISFVVGHFCVFRLMVREVLGLISQPNKMSVEFGWS